MTDTLNKEEYAEMLAEKIVESYDMSSLVNIVWDMTYDELTRMSWSDLLMMGEDYGVEIES
jgi:hypothetical protein